jgi:hypothetical protein
VLLPERNELGPETEANDGNVEFSGCFHAQNRNLPIQVETTRIRALDNVLQTRIPEEPASTGTAAADLYHLLGYDASSVCLPVGPVVFLMTTNAEAEQISLRRHK